MLGRHRKHALIERPQLICCPVDARTGSCAPRDDVVTFAHSKGDSPTKVTWQVVILLLRWMRQRLRSSEESCGISSAPAERVRELSRTLPRLLLAGSVSPIHCLIRPTVQHPWQHRAPQDLDVVVVRLIRLEVSEAKSRWSHRETHRAFAYAKS
jgi:hypothetical protein